jgi:alpha-beta hydrolase superfamily lysophospholipase
MSRLVFVLLLLLAACAPQLQDSGPPSAPPVLAQDHFLASDGAVLPLRVWAPEGKPRAILLALHGFNDYSNAWTQPAAWWADNGILTYALDQRGFGRGPNPGLWAGVDVMTRDVREALLTLHARHPGVPLYLLGESMGGAVALAAMADWQRDGIVQGVIISAPAVWARETMSWPQRAGLWFVAHVMPWNLATATGIRVHPSDNIEMLRALGRDPLVIKATRADAIWGLADMMDAGLNAAPKVRRPLLVLYGEKDDIVPRKSVELMLQRLAAPYRLALYPQGYHLLFRDLNGQLVWRDAAAWIEDRQAALPSGFERDERPIKIAKSAD